MNISEKDLVKGNIFESHLGTGLVKKLEELSIKVGFNNCVVIFCSQLVDIDDINFNLISENTFVVLAEYNRLYRQLETLPRILKKLKDINCVYVFTKLPDTEFFVEYLR